MEAGVVLYDVFEKKYMPNLCSEYSVRHAHKKLKEKSIWIKKMGTRWWKQTVYNRILYWGVKIKIVE